LAWNAIEYHSDGDQQRERAWLTAHDVTTSGTPGIEQLVGTKLTVATLYDGKTTISIVHDDAHVLAQVSGTTLGVLAADGMHYLVAETSSGLLVRAIWGI